MSAAVIYAELLVWLCIKDRRSIKWCILSGAAAVAVFLPWLGVAVSHLQLLAEAGSWFAPIGKKELIHFALYPIDFGWPISSVVYKAFILLYVCMLFLQCRKRKVFFAVSAAAVYIGMVAVGCIVSWIAKPVFCDRYAVQGVPLVGLSLAVLLSQSKKIKTARVAMCLLAVIALYANIQTFAMREVSSAKRYKDFAPAISAIKREDIIVTNELHRAGCLSYLTQAAKVYNVSATDKRNTLDKATDLSIIVFNHALLSRYDDVPYGDVKGDVYFAMNLDTAVERALFVSELHKAGRDVSFIGEYWLDYYHIFLYKLNKPQEGQ